MPIYAFACTACAHHFDRLQKLSDPDPVSCPDCGAAGVQRQLTAPSFRLSGSGWYETDFKKDGDRKRNLSEKAEGAGGGESATPEAKNDAKPVESAATPAPKSEPKTEVKPAAKPAAKPATGSAAPSV